jgi:hypothetical protein
MTRKKTYEWTAEELKKLKKGVVLTGYTSIGEEVTVKVARVEPELFDGRGKVTSPSGCWVCLDRCDPATVIEDVEEKT